MTQNPSGGCHLALGTISFTICFAAWGLVSAFAPAFRQLFHLPASETALLVAVPVLLGSLARIPMGMLTDRYGARLVFALLSARAKRLPSDCRFGQLNVDADGRWQSAAFFS
jgi:nitrate/nitrite transporter NarK